CCSRVDFCQGRFSPPGGQLRHRSRITKLLLVLASRLPGKSRLGGMQYRDRARKAVRGPRTYAPRERDNFAPGGSPENVNSSRTFPFPWEKTSCADTAWGSRESS